MTKSVKKKASVKKPVVKKAAPKKAKSVWKSYTAQSDILRDHKTGASFTAEIQGLKVEGRIYISRQGSIYYCQNAISGSSAPNKLGYNCSWIHDHYVRKLLIKKVEKSFPIHKYKLPPVFRLTDSRTAEIHKGFITVGCQTIKNSVIRKLLSRLID